MVLFLPVCPEHPVDVALLVLEGVKRLQDGRLRDEVLALRGEARLADGGGEVDGAGVAPARRLHGVHEVVLDLVQLELNLVPEMGKNPCFASNSCTLSIITLHVVLR